MGPYQYTGKKGTGYGVDDFTLMEIMEHSDHRMLRWYAQPIPEHARKALNSLPEWKVCQNSVKYLEGEEKANCSNEAQSIGIAGA